MCFTIAAGVAQRCEIQISYAIGVAQPVSISIETFGTSKMSESAIIELIKNNFDLSPSGIIKKLSLYNPIYLKTASYGHFGREDQDFPWERIDNIMGL